MNLPTRNPLAEHSPLRCVPAGFWSGRPKPLFHQALRILLFLACLFHADLWVSAEPSSLTEYQVKALFLLNFTKYIDWPADAFPLADSATTIGVIGEDHFGEDLVKAVVGKTVNDRKIVILPLATEDDWSKCQILFISASEKKRVPAILARLGNLPILTVGETDQFTTQGGIVNFTKKEGKVRLEIDLHAARAARLQISSRLLSVADVVRGKP